MLKKELEKRSLTAELRAKSEDSRTIYGYAAKFNEWSEPVWGYFREKIMPGAFDSADMSDVIVCFNHNPDTIMARTSSGTLKLTIDEVGLYFDFEAPNTTQGNDMLEMVRRGDISKCSFAFFVEEDSWFWKTEENGLEYDERTILRFARLTDVSLVVRPQYESTEASVRYLEERAKAVEPPKPKEVSTSYRDRCIEILKLNQQ